jgi:hypothetical protein
MLSALDDRCCRASIACGRAVLNRVFGNADLGIPEETS